MREKHCYSRQRVIVMLLTAIVATAKLTFLINKMGILKLVNEAEGIIAHLQVKHMRVCNYFW